MNILGKTNNSLRYLLFAGVMAIIGVVLPSSASAAPDPYLTGSGAITSYSGSAVSITSLQVAGTGNPTVPVKLRVTSGTLAMGTTTGLTFTGGSTGSTLQFSGTLADVNTALATLTYTRTGTGSDTLEASLVNAGEVFFTDTGHLYEYVSYTATWNNANTNAQTRTKYGATGYLTTITSQAENDFVAARLLNAGWMGASDAASEGDWKWVTGPESGTSFWSGASGGSPVSSRYANWGTGEPNNAGDEDCAQFLTGGTGKWNDLPCNTTTLPGYVVEYGSPSSPIDISALNLSITTLAANTTPSVPASLGATAYVNGSWGTDDAPALSFTLSDADVANTVQYRIQIDNNADFSSPVVDYTSALAAQGARTFTVGQAASGGSYAIGSSGQALADGQYYWRVRATDNVGASSGYSTANSGAIAFQVDTTAPTIPAAFTLSSAVNDTTPSFSWAASTDSSSGLHSTSPYTVQWSDDASFIAASTSSTDTNSFTVPGGQALADGTWYFRVRAKDALNITSNYTTSLSLIIDTTPPTIPGAPVLGSATNDNTPSWVWPASVDAGVGFGTGPYWVEWSQNSDFSGTIHTNVATTASYTHTVALADGTWYFRVKAIDGRDNESSYSVISSVTIDTRVPIVATTTAKRPQAVSYQTETTPVTEGAVPITGSTIPLVRVLVVDEKGNPVQGAKVTLHSNPRVAYSGVDGYAVFRDVEVGDHRVVVEYRGSTTEQPLAITEKDQDVLANVTLAKRVATSQPKMAEKSLRMWYVTALILAGFCVLVLARRRKKDKPES